MSKSTKPLLLVLVLPCEYSLNSNELIDRDPVLAKWIQYNWESNICERKLHNPEE